MKLGSIRYDRRDNARGCIVQVYKNSVMMKLDKGGRRRVPKSRIVVQPQQTKMMRRAAEWGLTLRQYMEANG